MTYQVLIGPANYAGQAYEWARAVRETTDIQAESFAHRARPFRIGSSAPFSFPVDQTWPHPKVSSSIGRHRRRRGLRRASHVLLDGFVPVGESLGRGLDSDIEWLSAHRIEVGLISHGSDLRHPQAHQEWNEHSYFRFVDPSWTRAMQLLVEQNEATLLRFPNIPVFVSTPDLLMHQPGATWLPLVVNRQFLEADAPLRFQRPRPTVLHVPSRRQPPIKGTQFIDPVLTALHDRGVINYVSPTSVRRSEMLHLMQRADIVVDQLMAGSYGLTAVEAMALGCVTVTQISADVLGLLPQKPPLVASSPQSFQESIVEILGSRSAHTELALAGRTFTREWHDGSRSAAIIAAWVMDQDEP